MSKQHAIFFISLFLTMTMGAFQNCSKEVSFGSNDGGQIVAYDIDPNLGDGLGSDINNDVVDNSNDDDMNNDDEVNNDDQANNTDDNSSDENNTEENDSDSDNYNEVPEVVEVVEDTDGDDCDKNNDNACKDKEQLIAENSNGLEHICILEGPGKSVRAGYTNAGIEAVGSTPRTICTSYEGCLAIGDARGDLKSIESPRGYCKNDSADSVQMSLEQVLAYYGGL